MRPEYTPEGYDDRMKGVPGQRKDCRFDHLVVAAVAKGYGTELRYQGIGTYERADEIRRGIYRCARHRGITAEAGHSREATTGEMGIWKTGSEWEVRYRVWDKKTARKRHLERYGPDRTKWPYDPRRAATPDEREQWVRRNELGQPVNH